MALPAIPFWFIRHGQTSYNLAGLAQGVLDIDLNETGQAQVRQAGPLLQGRGLTAMIASPMRRVKQTAQILNEFLHLPICYEDDLREVSFGDMEGKPSQPWFSDWASGAYTPEKGESFDGLVVRVEAALTRILLVRQGPVLIVAHGGVLRAVYAMMGLPKDMQTRNAVPLYCAPHGAGWQVSDAGLELEG